MCKKLVQRPSLQVSKTNPHGHTRPPIHGESSDPYPVERIVCNEIRETHPPLQGEFVLLTSSYEEHKYFATPLAWKTGRTNSPCPPLSEQLTALNVAVYNLCWCLRPGSDHLTIAEQAQVVGTGGTLVNC